MEPLLRLYSMLSEYQHHRRQFSGFSNMRNALQSRRDYMFIVSNVLNLFRSVRAIFL